MLNDKYSFWFSQQHADHYHEMNEYEHDEDEKLQMNFAAINGDLIPYTACTTVPDAAEPYEGAMQRWPDYKKVGEGTIKNIRSQGLW